METLIVLVLVIAYFIHIVSIVRALHPPSKAVNEITQVNDDTSEHIAYFKVSFKPLVEILQKNLHTEESVYYPQKNYCLLLYST